MPPLPAESSHSALRRAFTAYARVMDITFGPPVWRQRRSRISARHRLWNRTCRGGFAGPGELVHRDPCPIQRVAAARKRCPAEHRRRTGRTGRPGCVGRTDDVAPAGQPRYSPRS